MPRELKEKCFGSGRYTKAGFWGWIRSQLRRSTRRWPPIYTALEKAKRPYNGPRKGQRWEYQCSMCKEWYLQRLVAVDHIIPAGSLKGPEDLPGFVTRLFCEEQHLQILCHECHKGKTKDDNNL